MKIVGFSAEKGGQNKKKTAIISDFFRRRRRDTNDNWAGARVWGVEEVVQTVAPVPDPPPSPHEPVHAADASPLAERLRQTQVR